VGGDFSARPGARFPAQLQPQVQFETMAFRRDSVEPALDGLRGRIERLRKALGLRPGDRRWVRGTHAPHADAEYLENGFAVHATKLQQSISFCRGTAVRRIKFLLSTPILPNKGNHRQMGCAELMCMLHQREHSAALPTSIWCAFWDARVWRGPGPTPCCAQRLQWRSRSR